jgi:hypothetical protein
VLVHDVLLRASCAASAKGRSPFMERLGTRIIAWVLRWIGSCGRSLEPARYRLGGLRRPDHPGASTTCLRAGCGREIFHETRSSIGRPVPGGQATCRWNSRVVSRWVDGLALLAFVAASVPLPRSGPLSRKPPAPARLHARPPWRQHMCRNTTIGVWSRPMPTQITLTRTTDSTTIRRACR